MKTKFLSAVLLLLFICNINHAQTSASSAGIAIQGIARDANNTARVDQPVSLTFEMYYLNASNVEVEIFAETTTVQTDAFGVFSHVLDPGANNNAIIANTQAYLRIKEGTLVISNELLKHVPYAISANNGVPTGSIMPYMGTNPPPGWAICDGSSLTGIPGSADLIALLGNNNTPNLQGMFLRGTGTSPVNSRPGPALGQTQDSAFRNHQHFVNINTNSAGGHNHTVADGIRPDTVFIGQGGGGTSYANGDVINGVTRTTSFTGAHAHNVSGNDNFSVSPGNDFESRPVNYGVNYIIKL